MDNLSDIKSLLYYDLDIPKYGGFHSSISKLTVLTLSK